VLQTKLGDFAVNYEINAYTDDAHHIHETYSALHANILQRGASVWGCVKTMPTLVRSKTSRQTRRPTSPA
jgi:hypothetical protein